MGIKSERKKEPHLNLELLELPSRLEAAHHALHRHDAAPHAPISPHRQEATHVRLHHDGGAVLPQRGQPMETNVHFCYFRDFSSFDIMLLHLKLQTCFKQSNVIINYQKSLRRKKARPKWQQIRKCCAPNGGRSRS